MKFYKKKTPLMKGLEKPAKHPMIIEPIIPIFFPIYLISCRKDTIF